MKIAAFGFLMIICAGLSAQGLALEDEVYDNLPRLATLDGYKDAELPASVDLSAFCPPVRNQGDVYSCVGWAVGYGALTIKKAIRYNWQDKKVIAGQANSAMFIYNQIRGENCSQGARISAALELLRNTGDCLAGHFDTDIEDCYREPSPEFLAQITLDTISDYLALFGLDAEPREKVQRVIRALAQREPVIIGMNVLRNFYQLHRAKYWWPKIGNPAPAGGHAMVVVGYDLASASFLLFNSWGTDWGDEGYIRIKFSDFGEFCKYAFIIQLSESAAEPPVMNASGNIHPLRTLAGAATFSSLEDDAAQSFFRGAAVTHLGRGVYRCRRGAWPVGQLFQLAAWAEQSGLYLYVLSVDPRQKVNVHWPRSRELDAQFAGRNESALVLDSGAKAVVPGIDKALRLSNPGRDVLYVFFSSRPLAHMPAIAARLAGIKEEYRAGLEAFFGRHLIPHTDISFVEDRLAFSAATRHQGYIVPLILELQAE